MGGKRVPSSQIIGKRFGRLVGLSQVDGVNGFRQFLFVCDCGVTKIIRVASVTSGAVQSCGCLKSEISKGRAKSLNLTHGDSRAGMMAPEYGVYRTMLSRCYNHKVERFPLYGGRGIEVCDRWRGDGGYQRFIEDMGPRPKGMSIERMDSNGPYAPENCRWATAREQANNTSRNHLLTVDGRTQTISQWAREVGLLPSTLLQRLIAGWSGRDAVTKPLRSKVKH